MMTYDRNIPLKQIPLKNGKEIEVVKELMPKVKIKIEHYNKIHKYAAFSNISFMKTVKYWKKMGGHYYVVKDKRNIKAYQKFLKRSSLM